MQANHLTSQTLYRYFTALVARDTQGMQNCYAHGVRFEDPIFNLNGDREIMAMWALLFGPGRLPTDRTNKGQGGLTNTWAVDFHTVKTLQNHGSVRWEVTFRYAPTGRIVHNSVYSQFHFDDDGLILSQRDNFDFWRWARQAHGFLGMMLGWTPLMWDHAREQAEVSLQEVLTEQAALAAATATAQSL